MKRLTQLLFADAVSGEQELAESLRRIVGLTADHPPVTKTHSDRHALVLDAQTSCFQRVTKPLHQIRQRHGGQRPYQWHSGKLLLYEI